MSRGSEPSYTGKTYLKAKLKSAYPTPLPSRQAGKQKPMKGKAYLAAKQKASRSSRLGGSRRITNSM